MHLPTQPVRPVAALLALALALVSGCARGPEPPASRAERVAEGARLFARHCAPCHGAAADGRGPVAAHLTRVPPDLSRIALRRGGRFDAEEIAAFVDGRARVGAHGTSEMPVWGRAFAAGFGGGGEPIPPLVAYLRSIQVATPPPGREVQP